MFVLVILTLHSRPEQTTANLLGPLVVNARSGQAVQAVLSGSGYESQTLIVTKPHSLEGRLTGSGESALGQDKCS